MTDLALCVSSLKVSLHREFKRVFLEPSRVFSMLLQPLIFWFLFSMGFKHTFVYQSNISYQEYFFPGVLALVVLFSSIYSTLTLVEDKKNGFFLYMLSSPAGASLALLGKVIAAAVLGFTQTLLFLPFACYLFGNSQDFTLLITSLVAGSILFSIIGVLFAWVSPSSSAFHALMSVLLIPMWLLSGAMFPLEGSILEKILWVNPMAYLVKALRVALFGNHEGVTSLLMTLLLFIFIMAGLLFIVVRMRREDEN